MFKNYLKIAIRILARNKGYSFINITGLAIGMACCIMILLYVQHEFSYDRYHQHAREIYRVAYESDSYYLGTNLLAVTPAPTAPALLNDFPEVENAVRFYNTTSHNKAVIGYNDKYFYEERFFLADPSLFEIFDFPLVKGDPRTALQEPLTVVLTEDMARKYFGEEDPVGKVLSYGDKLSFKITGILKNLPPNSHFRFDFVSSWKSISSFFDERNLNWSNFSFYTYIKLSKKYRPEDLDKKLPAFLRKYGGERERSCRLYLQPLTRIRLRSKLNFELEPNGDIRTVSFLSSIAAIILLIACINFMNLSTARSSDRSREVGIRKVIGAKRSQLVRQFLNESIILSFVALVFALFLVELFLPLMTSITGVKLELNWDKSLSIAAGLCTIALLVGIIAGSYPAFFLTAFQPVRVLKGILTAGARGSFLRKILVVAQFVASIVFIIGTFIVSGQLAYIKNKKLGFSQENVIVIPLYGLDVQQRYETIKDEFLKNPSILSAAFTFHLPGQGGGNQPFWLDAPQENKEIQLDYNIVDHDFIDTFGIELVEGRKFSKQTATDAGAAFILSESAARQLGQGSLVGRKFGLARNEGTVIGVVKDFHFRSLHQKIEPFVLFIRPRSFRFLSLRVRPDDMRGTLYFIKNKWAELSPSIPFEYSFLDEENDKLYKAEKRIGQIFSVSSFLAIFVACLGLFGLTSFTTERRTKEIGIRKVLGVKLSHIIFIISREFTSLVIVANLMAWPVAYYAMNRWLQGFAYRIDLRLWIFPLTALITVAITLATVCYKALKAARANPVEALRYE